MAALLYVLCNLVDDDIPMSAGCLKPLRFIIPSGSTLNPNPPASVVAGNVETSSCITNALYGALGVMAASILSNGRIHGAFGMAGGQPGQVGINRVVRGDGSVEELGHIGQAEMLPGDVFEIHSPGCGGCGTPKPTP